MYCRTINLKKDIYNMVFYNVVLLFNKRYTHRTTKIRLKTHFDETELTLRTRNHFLVQFYDIYQQTCCRKLYCTSLDTRRVVELCHYPVLFFHKVELSLL